MSQPHADLPERVAALRVWCTKEIGRWRHIVASDHDHFDAEDRREAQRCCVVLEEVLGRLGFPIPPLDKDDHGPR